jgi:hypothetical protein
LPPNLSTNHTKSAPTSVTSETMPIPHFGQWGNDTIRAPVLTERIGVEASDYQKPRMPMSFRFNVSTRPRSSRMSNSRSIDFGERLYQVVQIV